VTFSLLAQRKRSPKRNGLPEQSNPAIGTAFGIFVLAIPWLGPKHAVLEPAAVHGRRPSGLASVQADHC